MFDVFMIELNVTSFFKKEKKMNIILKNPLGNYNRFWNVSREITR